MPAARPSACRRARVQRGLTMVELMLALAILVIGGLAVYGALAPQLGACKLGEMRAALSRSS